MKFMFKLKAALAVGVFIAAVFTSARAQNYGEVTVLAAPASHSIRSHGYQEYKITVSNRSLRNSHQVRLLLPERGYYGGSVSRTVTVEPSSTQAISLFSSFTMGGNGLGVEIDGELKKDIVSLNINGFSFELRPSVLISQGAVAKGFATKASSILIDSSRKETFVAANAEEPSTEWSTNWLGYSSFDGVVITAEELRGMPEPASSALIRYVECGGSLLVLNPWEPANAWRDDSRSLSGSTVYYLGLGAVTVVANASNGITEPILRTAYDQWMESREPWRSSPPYSFSFTEANKVFPVTENIAIPVRGLLLIMLLFVIVIGPVNLVVLTKKKKRMWLLLTVPAISIATCLAVSIYSLFSEGWSARARYATFTVLDERAHRATTIGLSAFYAPLTPGDGLRYSAETEITSREAGPSYSNDGNLRTLDWTDGQHLESGWVTARTPAHFMVRRSETRRERLSVSQGQNSSLSVVNGLGVPIKSLWVSDERGSIYKGSDIAPGSSANLELSKERLPVESLHGLRERFTGGWIGIGEPARHLSLLRPRTYLAEIDGCPFLEEGLRGVGRKRCEAVVFGIMRTSTNED